MLTRDRIACCPGCLGHRPYHKLMSSHRRHCFPSIFDAPQPVPIHGSMPLSCADGWLTVHSTCELPSLGTSWYLSARDVSVASNHGRTEKCASPRAKSKAYWQPMQAKRGRERIRFFLLLLPLQPNGCSVCYHECRLATPYNARHIPTACITHRYVCPGM